MRRLLGNSMSVIISAIRLTLMKIINSNIKFHLIERISPNVVIEVSRKAKCNFGKMVRIHSGTKIKVRNGAELSIGDNVRMNYNCILVSHEKIVIKDGVEFGPNVLIYDHDHDYRCEGGIKAGRFRTSPVYIGEDSWIGAGAIILRGSIIGKNCIIAAGTVVQGTIPDNTILVQKKVNTLKEINI